MRVSSKISFHYHRKFLIDVSFRSMLCNHKKGKGHRKRWFVFHCIHYWNCVSLKIVFMVKDTYQGGYAMAEFVVWFFFLAEMAVGRRRCGYNRDSIVLWKIRVNGCQIGKSVLLRACARLKKDEGNGGLRRYRFTENLIAVILWYSLGHCEEICGLYAPIQLVETFLAKRIVISECFVTTVQLVHQFNWYQMRTKKIRRSTHWQTHPMFWWE